jgi:transposase
VRNALEWAQVRALVADGVSEREIARRLGINRRTAARLARSGYTGSLRLVQERLQRLRPSSVRPAQRTGYRPGQVLQLDWAEMPTPPVCASTQRI